MRRFIASIFICSSLVAAAQSPKPISLTPEKVLDAYEAAIRKGATARPVSYYVRVAAYLNDLPAGPSWDTEGYYVEDGRFREWMKSQADNSQRGYDGKRSWRSSNSGVLKAGPNQFERLVDSKEVTLASPEHFGFDFIPPSKDWRKSFVKLEILGQSKVDNHEVIVLRATVRTGRSLNFYYDASSFLLRRADVPVDIHKGTGETGGFVVSLFLRKYVERGGWMIPEEIYEKAPEYSVRRHLVKFEINPQITDEMLEPKP